MIERTIPAGSGMVKVTREGDTVTVQWVCGARRMFTLDDLRSGLANVDAVSEFSDAWVNDRDSSDRRYFARVEGDDFYADEAPADGASHVSWEALRAALTDALAEPEAKKPRRGVRKKS